MIPIIHRGPSPEGQTALVLHRLNNLLEYSVGKNHRLTTLRALTPTYIKALSDTRKTEFYFPCKVTRTRPRTCDGYTSISKFQILSVLKREDRDHPIMWDAVTGEPTFNAKLLDDMRDGSGKVWPYGIMVEAVSLLRTSLGKTI